MVSQLTRSQEPHIGNSFTRYAAFSLGFYGSRDMISQVLEPYDVAMLVSFLPIALCSLRNAEPELGLRY